MITENLPAFSMSQWQFLALYQAVAKPLSIDTAGHIVPLLPGPFLDLFKKAVDLGWLIPRAEGLYQFAKAAPPGVVRKLDKINSPHYLTSVVNRIQSDQGIAREAGDIAELLLIRAGKSLDVAQEEYQRAKIHISENRLDEAFSAFQKTLSLIALAGDSAKSAKLFVSVVIHYSYLSTLYGKATRKTYALMQKALKLSENIGDIRSRAVLKMQLGLYLFLTHNLSNAISSLSSGLDIVRQLGDEDIRSQTTSYIGFYYFMRGRYREAARYCLQAFQDGIEIKYNPYILSVMGYSLGFQGRFSTAIGCMDYIRTLARHQADPQMAAYCRIVIGLLLIFMGDMPRGKAVMEEAMLHNQKKSPNFAEIQYELGMGYAEYLSGAFQSAVDHFKNAFSLFQGLNMQYRNFIPPWMIEAYYELSGKGFSLPGFQENFRDDMAFYINEPNIVRKGIALRMRVQRDMAQGSDLKNLEADLLESEQYLDQAGDVFELAKTRLCMAGLKRRMGIHQQAAWYAGQAGPELSRYRHMKISEDLLRHVSGINPMADNKGNPEDMFQRLLDMVENLLIMDIQLNPPNFLFRFIVSSAHFLGAERGAYFHYSEKEKGENPGFNLMGQFNMDSGIFEDPDFLPSLTAVKTAFDNGEPRVFISDGKDSHQGSLMRSYLCLPLKNGPHARGVLYYDNRWLDAQYNNVPMNSLKRISILFDNAFNQVFQIYRRIRTDTDSLIEQKTHLGPGENSDFMTISPVMKKMLKQIDRIAASDAPVLITGETGVGKGLLAKRIHEKSSRKERPFIVVDLNTIPENLVESELFGYEKGAFTGADRKKIGHLEMAHRGTLFMDEIGEIPHALQSKLLQFVQEKSFTRIGGTQLIKSDFRLITATNRDLSEDVRKGAFRLDLFHRLNVIPFVIPSLAERREDILYLARHFLRNYATKHHKPNIRLSARHEQMLSSYHWPGNVRELANIMERCILLSPENPIDLILPLNRALSTDHPFSDTPTMEDLQRRYIDFVLNLTNGKIGGSKGAAAILGMKRSTLYTRMDRLGIRGGEKRGV